MQRGFWVAVVEAAYPVTPLPVLHMLLPAESLQQSVADVAIGDMRDDRTGIPDSRDFKERPDGPRERLVPCTRPGSNVVEREK